MGLDVKDKKILGQLTMNARQSNIQIAKRAGLSKDVVGYRIKCLKKKNIIKSYYSILNIAKLGYMTYKILITFQNTTYEIENEIIDYFTNNNNTGWIVSCEGFYNLMIVLFVENEIIFNKIFQDFLKKYSQYIKERDILLITENHTGNNGFLLGRQSYKKDIFYGGSPEILVDKTEMAIIKIISNNARIPLYEIAIKMNMTAEAIAYRLKQLQKKNIVQGFRAKINMELLGYQYYNIIFRLKKFNNIEKMFKYFQSNLNIVFFVKSLGNYDVGIDLQVKNIDELRSILVNIKQLFHEDIESYQSILIFKEYKLSYLP